MKKAKNIIIITVIIAALIVIKIFFLSNDETSKVQQQTKDPSVVVSAYIIKPEKFDNKIFSSGTIIANEEVDLKPEASGKVVQILFKEGLKVSKGDLLLKLNDADLKAQQEKLELQIKLAAEMEAHQKQLLTAGGTSQEAYDAALNQLNTAKADLDLVLAQIQKTEIIAPFTGTIGLKYVSEGSYVSPTVKIASMQQLDPVKIDFSVPERYTTMVHKGDSVYFTTQGRSEQFTGTIYAIEPKIDLATRTLLLRAICDNKSGKLLPGSFAKVELILQQMDNTILIPTQAIIPDQKGQTVYLCKNGIAKSVVVETGTRTETDIEITNGLHAGDTVITAGIMQVKPGVKIKITDLR